jgi:hypothetical protein
LAGTSWCSQFEQDLPAKTFRIDLARFCVLNYFRNNEFGHGLAGFAIEFKSLAYLLKRQPHGFYVLWADYVLREWHRRGPSAA